MTFYLIIFVAIALLTPLDLMRCSAAVRSGALLVCFALLLLLAGLRVETGNDWEPYQEYYLDLASLSDKAEDFEVGYRSLAYLFKTAGVEYGGFLFASTLLYLGLFLLVFRRQRAPIILALLFYCTYLLGWMGTARQVLAIACTLLAGEFLLQRQHLRFLLSVFLAGAFHVSALLFLMAWLLAVPLQTTRRYLLIVGIAVAAGIALQSVAPALIDRITGVEGIGEKVVFYGQIGAEGLDLASGEGMETLWYAKRLLFFFLFLSLRHHWQGPRLAFYFNCYVASVAIFMAIQPLAPILALRGSNYFAIYELFLLAVWVKDARPRWVALLFPLILVLAGQRLYTSLYAYHPDLYLPYKGLFINEHVQRNMY